MDKENVMHACTRVHTHTREYYSAIREGNLVVCDNMDGS